jgi:hypothetical protein
MEIKRNLCKVGTHEDQALEIIEHDCYDFDEMASMVATVKRKISNINSNSQRDEGDEFQLITNDEHSISDFHHNHNIQGETSIKQIIQ